MTAAAPPNDPRSPASPSRPDGRSPASPARPDGNPSPPALDLDAAIERERLAPGPEALPEPFVADSQRGRILNALAEACAAKGYPAVTIADICKGAGVSRATFYELFRDKDDCFEATMELALAEAMSAIGGAYSADKPWPTMVRDATAALLRLLAERPAFARAAMVDAPASGERAFELYAGGKRVLQVLLDRGREDPVEEEAIPTSAGRAALSGAEALIVGQILAGNAERLPELLPDIVYIITVPYLGQAEALRQSQEAEKLLGPPGG